MFNAEEFVHYLLKEGATVACDETDESFNEDGKLPAFYDEEKFKRGQAFFHKHVFGQCFAKMLGLMTVLSVPSSLNILILTNMSSSPMSAYKRYMATLLHMIVWYDSDFRPGSRLWDSIEDIKCRHNSASKKSCAAGLGRINQKDMAITQFGFMGYAVTRPKMVGIHNATDEELNDFIHLWRVVGHILGLQDRFNICRESVEETKQICELLMQNLLKPLVMEKQQDFMEMSRYVCEGMWALNPCLHHNVLLCYIYKLLNNSTTEWGTSKLFVDLDFYGKYLMCLFQIIMFALKFTLARIYFNYVQYSSFWIIQTFPFLAYYKFGYRNSHVKILNTIKAY